MMSTSALSSDSEHGIGLMPKDGCTLLVGWLYVSCRLVSKSWVSSRIVSVQYRERLQSSPKRTFYSLTTLSNCVQPG